MSVTDWSIVQDDNATTDPTIPAMDGASGRKMPDLVRGVMAKVAAYVLDQGGSLITSGTSNAYTVITNSGISVLKPGVSVTFIADRDNTDVPTLNVDGTGPKPIQTPKGVALDAGSLKAGVQYSVLWYAAAGAISAGWRLKVNVYDGALDNDALAPMPAVTFKANPTGAAAAPVDVTPDQAKQVLDYHGTEVKHVRPGGATRNVSAELGEQWKLTQFSPNGSDWAPALAALHGQAPVGAPLTIPPGTYALNSSVSMAGRTIDISGCTFTGAGRITGAFFKRRRPNGTYAMGGASTATNLGQGLQIGGGDPWQGTEGVTLNCDGAATWLRLQPSANEQPIELVTYSTAAQGDAVTVASTATGNIRSVPDTESSPFQASWVGRKFYLGASIFRISAVQSATQLTVTNLDGSPVVFGNVFTTTFHVFAIRGTGLCNVNGQTVTRVSGDPFVGFGPIRISVNGAPVTFVSFQNSEQWTIAENLGTLSNVPYTFETDINDQLATWRLQKRIGSNEENISLFVRANGEYWMATLQSGAGRHWPLFLSSGYLNGQLAGQVALYPDGSVSLGGPNTRDSLRVAGLANAVNRIEVFGAATGLSPSLRARGADANVGLPIDLKGFGRFSLFTDTFGTEMLAVQKGLLFINSANVPPFASDAAAGAAGLATGTIYRNSSTNALTFKL